MGFLIVFVLVGLAFAALWRFGNLPRTALELAGSAMFLGIAGYAAQGSPDVPGTVMQAMEKPGRPTNEALIQIRQQMSGRFGTDAQWLVLTDRLLEMGQSQTAVVAARSGLRDNRYSPQLWVGLGNALVAHGDGLVSPAAEFAYRRAGQLAPDDPAPPFFYGVALAQSGQTERAVRVWRMLLARSPADAPWRAPLEAKLAEIEKATGRGQP
jgi:cytochrome c-type biogenesis protein CcmH